MLHAVLVLQRHKCRRKGTNVGTNVGAWYAAHSAGVLLQALSKAPTADVRAAAAAAAQAPSISQVVLEVYTKLLATFTQEQQQHYCFTPRDLTRWVQGLTR
jgi:hypothetical protein